MTGQKISFTFEQKHLRSDDGPSEESATTQENEDQTSIVLNAQRYRRINTIIQLKRKHFDNAVKEARYLIFYENFIINYNLFFREHNLEVPWTNGETKVTLEHLPLTNLTPVNIYLFLLNKFDMIKCFSFKKLDTTNKQIMTNNNGDILYNPPERIYGDVDVILRGNEPIHLQGVVVDRGQRESSRKKMTTMEV